MKKESEYNLASGGFGVIALDLLSNTIKKRCKKDRESSIRHELTIYNHLRI